MQRNRKRNTSNRNSATCPNNKSISSMFNEDENYCGVHSNKKRKIPDSGNEVKQNYCNIPLGNSSINCLENFEKIV